jgi:hypothetical protein
VSEAAPNESSKQSSSESTGATDVSPPAASSPVEAAKESVAAAKPEEKAKKPLTEAQRLSRAANAAKAREAYLRKIELKRRLEQTSQEVQKEKEQSHGGASESKSAPETDEPTEEEKPVPVPVKDDAKEEKKEEKAVADTIKNDKNESKIATEVPSAPVMRRKRFEDLMLPNRNRTTVTFEDLKRFMPTPKKPRFSVEDLL